MRIAFIGDVFGKPGRQAVARWVPQIQAEFGVDFIVANAENSAGGTGATSATLSELSRAGVHAFTMGNHTWRKKELLNTINHMDNIVRPANFPEGVPGRGAAVVPLPDGRRVGLVNVIGRVFMEAQSCPFRAAERAIEQLKKETDIILVDMHAEATSEKIALGRYLDGTCSAVVGTHTHVQTADECVLPEGTAYITDVGMTGPLDSAIGVSLEPILSKFLTGIPATHTVAKGPIGLQGVVVDIDDTTGLARSITRIRRDEREA